LPATAPADRRAEIEHALAKVKTELVRLTGAIIAGGELPTVTQAIKARERQRGQLERELQTFEELSQVSEIDTANLERELSEILAGRRDLLAKQTPQARQILRKLLDGRLTFTPREDRASRYYEFTGTGILDPVLTGRCQ
jgi:hypothetical protein